MSRATQDPAAAACASRKGLSPATAGLSRPFRSRAPSGVAVLLPRAGIVTGPVWALPRSLATTWGITVVFSSWGY